MKEKGDNRKTRHELCDNAAEYVKAFEDTDDLPESDYPKNTWVTGKTVMRWFHQFQKNKESFINFPLRASELDKAPPFFDLNPTFKNRFLRHA